MPVSSLSLYTPLPFCMLGMGAHMRHLDGEEDYVNSIRSVSSDPNATQSDGELSMRLKYTGSLTSSGKYVLHEIMQFE